MPQHFKGVSFNKTFVLKPFRSNCCQTFQVLAKFPLLAENFGNDSQSCQQLKWLLPHNLRPNTPLFRL